MSSVTAVPISPVKRRYVVYLLLGIVLAVVAAAALAFQAPVDFLSDNGRKAGVVTTPSGLQYQVLAKGQGGATPTDADVALVNYVGKLPDGSVFDQSQQPMPMPVAGVVPGFSEALKLMPKGAKYRLWIKPELGYGGPRPAGAPPLDPKAVELATKVLEFEVELLDFLPESVIRQMQMQQQMQQQMPGRAPGGVPAAPPPPGR